MEKVQINGKDVEVREPKVRDLRAVSQYQSEEDKEVHLISNITGLTTDEIDDLSIKEYRKLQEKLQGFLS
ncbi:phage tail assembly protein [Halarcobacter anaerophilus]|uniref:phage tail assembly protein n=1 Tax=Halarcobacter anaerophilus TaxID=877500 RepID=UPI0005CA3529|nr:phage tail assembly protein [Halarcobacter anaerophilus]